MNTRRVPHGERRRQNGWASASEYDVLRGLNGTAVTFKASLQDSQEQRELLYALQAFSLREGGLVRLARELLEMFPERIGSPTMHKIGCKPGKRLTDDQSDAISCELLNTDAERSWRSLLRHYGDEEKKDVRPAEAWLDTCRKMAGANLVDFIEELCCDPKMEVAPAASVRGNYRNVVNIVLEDARDQMADNPHLAKDRPDLKATLNQTRDFRFAKLPYFHDVLGALQEYVRRQVEAVRASYAETSISKIVFEAADYVLETESSALIEGESGYGKSTSLKAWCAMHPGQARYLELRGIMDATVFFRRLAKVCGVASGAGLSVGKMQARIEDFLQRSKLLLIIDEAQYLWPQGKRISAHPKFINWLNTACYNAGVPFLLSATKDFTRRRQAVEAQTDWNSGQSRRRIRRVFLLPDAPTEADLRIVARKSLPGIGKNAEDYLVNYALHVSRGYFQTIDCASKDAQLIARRAGRAEITAKDLLTAVKEWRAPSDAALQRVYEAGPESARRRKREVTRADFEPVEPPLNAPLNEFSASVFGRRATQPTAVPTLTG